MTGNDWELPERFFSETHLDGRVMLWRDGVIAKEFPPSTPKPAIEVWASVYESGHKQGHTSGVGFGRLQLILEFRNLLQI
jgi:hypothetical protein